MSTAVAPIAATRMTQDIVPPEVDIEIAIESTRAVTDFRKEAP